MLTAIKAMLDGDRAIVEKFARANTFWEEFFADKRSLSEAEMADALGLAQTGFEFQAFDGERDLAKEVMPATCLGYLYDLQEGFGDNEELAVRVARAFAKSMVSLEVKSAAKRAIVMFHLEDDVK